jgi:hypothetical protein
VDRKDRESPRDLMTAFVEKAQGQLQPIRLRALDGGVELLGEAGGCPLNTNSPLGLLA